MLPAHYVAIGANAGAPGLVTIVNTDTNQIASTLEAYDKTMTAGASVELGDFTGDGVLDIVTTPGVGGAPHVRIFDGVTGQQLQTALGNFFSGDPTAREGVDVATWDANNDGLNDLFAIIPTDKGISYKLFDGSTGKDLPIAVGQITSPNGELIALLPNPVENDTGGNGNSTNMVYIRKPFEEFERPPIWDGRARPMTPAELANSVALYQVGTVNNDQLKDGTKFTRDSVIEALIKMGRPDLAQFLAQRPGGFQLRSNGSWLGNINPTGNFEIAVVDGVLVIDAWLRYSPEEIAKWLVDYSEGKYDVLGPFFAEYNAFLATIADNEDGGSWIDNLIQQSGLAAGSTIPPDNKAWYDATLAAAPYIMASAAFQLALDLCPGVGAGKLAGLAFNAGWRVTKIGGRMVYTVGGKLVTEAQICALVKSAAGRVLTNAEMLDVFCFEVGTLVRVPNGVKAIEEIVVDDLVSAYDFTEARWTSGRVVGVTVTYNEGRYAEVATDRDVLRSTADHAYWVTEGEDLASRPETIAPGGLIDGSSLKLGRWVAAADLRIGDVLSSCRGPVAVRTVSLSERVLRVCCLQVAGLNNFRVGVDGILVHNKCFKDLLVEYGKPVPAKLVQIINDGIVAKSMKLFQLAMMHGRHIVQKAGGGATAQKARDLLKLWGVGLLDTEASIKAAGRGNLHNLCHAINGYKGIHSEAYDAAVLARLERAVALSGGDAVETKRLIHEALDKMAEILERGDVFW